MAFVILGYGHWWRTWAFLKWGGHSGLESTSNTTVLWRWQHHVPKTCLKMSVSALPVLDWHILRLLWLHSKPHTVVRPVYLGATLILSRLLSFFTLKKREWTRRLLYLIQCYITGDIIIIFDLIYVLLNNFISTTQTII